PLADPHQGPTASFLVTSPGYFAAIDLPLITGRTFTDTDGNPGQQSAVVTRALAESFWPHQNAIGKRLRYFKNDKPVEWLTVVGVVANFVQRMDLQGTERILIVP